MGLPGIHEEKEVRTLLKKLLEKEDGEQVFKFAVVARGPKDGDLILSKKEPLRRKEVVDAAEGDARNSKGGKPLKLDVMVGDCCLAKDKNDVLLLRVNGKAAARAVSCIEHLLTLGPYKMLGFVGVLLEEVDGETVAPPPIATPSTPEETSKAPEPAPIGENDVQAFAKRLAGLMPEIKRAAGVPAGELAKLRASEAGVLARKGDVVAAHRLLDEVERLLQEAANAPAGVVNEPSTEPTSNPSGFSKVRFEKMHLAWEDGKREVRTALQRLHGAIVGEYSDPEATTAATKLDKVLARFNEGLGDTLDELRNAASDEARGKLATKADEIVARYLDYLFTDALVVHVEANPFQVPVTVRQTLAPPLQNLRRQLEPLIG